LIEIQNHLSHLASYNDDKDEMAKKFDLIIYQLQNAILHASKRQNYLIQNIQQIGNALDRKKNIPAIKAQQATIDAVISDDFWTTITLQRLEKVRTDLRGLLHLLKDEPTVPPVYSNFTDLLDVQSVKERDLLENYTTLQSYKDRVEHFIRKNKHHLVIDKIYKNIPITPLELASLEQFLTHEKFQLSDIEKEYGTKSLGVFVRKVLGMDIEAANKHFASFIQEENLSANQILFVQKIIDYLNKNGVLEKHMLTQPPFTDMDDHGILGIFEESHKASKIVKLIEEITQISEIA
jgi:type I restriction enzyme R subunit